MPLALPATLRSAGYHRRSMCCFGAILQQAITWDYADQVLKLPCGVTMGLLMTNIMINQHWPRQWFGIVRQKALAYSREDLWGHISSHVQNELTNFPLRLHTGVSELDRKLEAGNWWKLNCWGSFPEPIQVIWVPATFARFCQSICT